MGDLGLSNWSFQALRQPWCNWLDLLHSLQGMVEAGWLWNLFSSKVHSVGYRKLTLGQARMDIRQGQSIQTSEVSAHSCDSSYSGHNWKLRNIQHFGRYQPSIFDDAKVFAWGYWVLSHVQRFIKLHFKIICDQTSLAKCLIITNKGWNKS